MIRTPSINSAHSELGDPLSAHLRPPPGESEHDRQLRLQQEAEAKRISDSIDEELRQDAKRLQKRKQDVKVCSSATDASSATQSLSCSLYCADTGECCQRQYPSWDDLPPALCA
jgi:hypothetical protein